MTKFRSFVIRLARDEAGGPATEAALLLALVAAIAGFGMVTLGDSLANFFNTAGNSFDPGAAFPSQGNSSTIGGS